MFFFEQCLESQRIICFNKSIRPGEKCALHAKLIEIIKDSLRENERLSVDFQGFYCRCFASTSNLCQDVIIFRCKQSKESSSGDKLQSLRIRQGDDGIIIEQ